MCYSRNSRELLFVLLWTLNYNTKVGIPAFYLFSCNICIVILQIMWFFVEFMLDKNDEICIIIIVPMKILSLVGDRVLCTED